MVAAHGDITKHGDLLVGAACVLPSLDERAIMEVDGKLIIRGFDDIHLEHELSGLGKQGFAKSLQAVGLALLHKIGTVGESATLDRRASEIAGIKPSFLRLVAKQIADN